MNQDSREGEKERLCPYMNGPCERDECRAFTPLGEELGWCRALNIDIEPPPPAGVGGQEEDGVKRKKRTGRQVAGGLDTMAQHRRGAVMGGNLKRVALVGTGHGHQLAPGYGHVWCMNDLGIYRYCTMLWDLHDFTWTDQQNYDNYAHMSEEISEDERWKRAKGRRMRFDNITKFCIETNVPLMSVKKYQNIPSSFAFPLEKIIDHFHRKYGQGADYLTSALSQCLAYAIYRDFTQIDLFGINVEMGTEWVYQRDAVSFWVGLALGEGRRVTCSGSARRPLRIIDKRIYGFGVKQKDAGVEMIVADIRRPNTYIAVWDESDEGIARYHEAKKKKEPGPHVKLWKTDKKMCFVKADGPPGELPAGAKRVPQDEATIEIKEAEATYRFSPEEGEAMRQTAVDVVGDGAAANIDDPPE